MSDPTVSASVTPVDQSDGKRALADWLTKKFATYKTDRNLAELQWMINLRQYLGKYDSDFETRMTQGTSRAYPKKTRIKCVSMKARLMDLLFPASEKNWSLEPSPVPSLPASTLATIITKLTQGGAAAPGQLTQETIDQLVADQAREISNRQELIIDDQLKDIDPYGCKDYETLCGQVVDSAVKYGPGIVKGPMVIQSKVSTIRLDATGMPQVLTIDTYRPYFEFVPCWDYYPDMTAKTFAQMDGEFQRHVMSKAQLSELAKRPDFDSDQIHEFMRREPKGNYKKLNYETDLDNLGGQAANKLPEGHKYELLEYWGSASAAKLRAAGIRVDPEPLPNEAEDADPVAPATPDDELVAFTAWVLGDVMIKGAKNPYPYGVRTFHQFIFEEDEINLLGSGLPPIMRDSQMAISNFSRMLLDNASVVCGPNVEVDVDRLAPSMTDTTIGPFKTWLIEGGSSGSPAVRSVSFDSHINELMEGINLFAGFADQETFVSPATGGDMDGVPGEAFRTTGGASMIYGNAALPFKDIVRNFDKFTTSVIYSLVQFNQMFHEDAESLQGDIRPIPRGATSLMAKEMRSVAMDNLSQTLNPQEQSWINTPNLLKERLKVRDLSATELLLTEDQHAQQQAQAQQQQTQQLQLQMAQMQADISNTKADTLKQISQAQKNMDNGDAAIFKALSDALAQGMNTDDIARITQRAAQGRSAGQGQPAAGSAAPVAQLPTAAAG